MFHLYLQHHISQWDGKCSRWISQRCISTVYIKIVTPACHWYTPTNRQAVQTDTLLLIQSMTAKQTVLIKSECFFKGRASWFCSVLQVIFLNQTWTESEWWSFCTWADPTCPLDTPDSLPPSLSVSFYPPLCLSLSRLPFSFSPTLRLLLWSYLSSFLSLGYTTFLLLSVFLLSFIPAHPPFLLHQAKQHDEHTDRYEHV